MVRVGGSQMHLTQRRQQVHVVLRCYNINLLRIRDLHKKFYKSEAPFQDNTLMHRVGGHYYYYRVGGSAFVCMVHFRALCSLQICALFFCFILHLPVFAAVKPTQLSTTQTVSKFNDAMFFLSLRTTWYLQWFGAH